MIFYEVRNIGGRLIASNINKCPVSEKFLGLERENKRIKNARNVFRENEHGSVRLVIVDDQDLYNSNRLINRVIDVYFTLIPEFARLEGQHRQYFDLLISRFVHNLSKVQRKIKDCLIRLASDSAREKNTYSEFKEAVESRIKSNTSSAAEDLCQISHRVVDLDAQIDGLRIISGSAEDLKPSLINISLHKALTRLLHPFIEEFNKKSVTINLQIERNYSDQNKVRIDPQLFNVALWQFFDNAVKYTKDKTQIKFTAALDKSPRVLTCEMTSLKIEDDETSKIFQEKYKGKNARAVPGEGIGMFMVKQALKIMNANIKVAPDHSSEITDGEKKYSKNVFIFELSAPKTS